MLLPPFRIQMPSFSGDNPRDRWKILTVQKNVGLYNQRHKTTWVIGPSRSFTLARWTAFVNSNFLKRYYKAKSKIPAYFWPLTTGWFWIRFWIRFWLQIRRPEVVSHLKTIETLLCRPLTYRHALTTYSVQDPRSSSLQFVILFAVQAIIPALKEKLCCNRSRHKDFNAHVYLDLNYFEIASVTILNNTL